MESTYTSVILTILTIITGTLTIITFAKNGKKESNVDSKERGRMEEKLDNIGKCVEEIRQEVKELRNNENASSQKLATTEESCKSAHKRIDRLSEKIASIEKYIREVNKNVG